MAYLRVFLSVSVQYVQFPPLPPLLTRKSLTNSTAASLLPRRLYQPNFAAATVERRGKLDCFSLLHASEATFSDDGALSFLDTVFQNADFFSDFL